MSYYSDYEYKWDYLANFRNELLLWKRKRGTQQWELCADGNGCDIVIVRP